MSRIREIATSHPGIDLELGGGLAEVLEQIDQVETADIGCRPVQLTDDAFRMLRKAIANIEVGLSLNAEDIVAAAELVEAGYAAVHDAPGRIECKVTPAGAKYMEMIDSVLDRLTDRNA